MFENPEQAFGGTNQLLGLIELIYSAVSDTTLWPTILDRMDEAVDGEQTLFFAALTDPKVPEALASIRTSPEVAKGYLDHFASVNVLAEPCDQMFPEGSVRYSHWAMSDAEFERSEFYCDFFRCHDVHYTSGLKCRSGTCRPPTSVVSGRNRRGHLQSMRGSSIRRSSHICGAH